MKLLRQISLLFLGLIAINISGQSEISNPEISTDWMRSSQVYYRFYVREDGIYKIEYTDLVKSGFPIHEVAGGNLAIYSNGAQVRIYCSTDEFFTDKDYVLVYGEKNKGQIDALLYEDPDFQLNPAYSLYSDERAYYLTWEEGNKLRYDIKSNGIVNTGLPLKEEHYIHHETVVYNDFHFKPTHNGRDFIRFSSMEKAEGFGSTLESDREIILPVNKLTPSGGDPRIEMRFGTNVVSRQWQVTVNDWAVANVSSPSYGVVNIDARFTKDLINNVHATVRIRSLNDHREKHSLAYITLKYPRQYDFEQRREYTFFQSRSIIPRLVEIKNFRGARPVMLNITEGWLINPESILGTVRFVSPESLKEWQWAIADIINGVKSPGLLTPVTKPVIPEGNYWIVSGAAVAKGAAISEYAQYRASVQGGAYNTAIINIDDYYDAYGYGIKGHPIVFKNLLNAVSLHQIKPSHIFIIGKGTEYPEERKSNTKSIVPTFGVPGSDQLLVSHSSNSVADYDYAIGRLAVNNNQGLANYLSKIKLQEDHSNVGQTIDELAWRKRLLHLSGGSADIQNLIYGYLNNMANVINNNNFGGEVITFRKTSADPIQKSRSEEIIQEINYGVSLLTFFGHSAVGTFDFSLEKPSAYNNEGANPVILSLGCHSGNIYTQTTGISEEFVLSPGAGAIAFIASSGTAYIEPQYQLGRRFYDLLGEEAYDKTIGETTKSLMKEFSQNKSISYATLCQQFTLHGDPAYRLVDFKGPDLTIDAASVRVSPEIIDISTESIKINFDLVNLGSIKSSEVEIWLVHTSDNGQQSDTVVINALVPGFRKNLELEIKGSLQLQSGMNNIQIIVDPRNLIQELPDPLAELNNELIMSDGKKGYDFVIYDNGAKPVFPGEFAIVNGQVSLHASIANALMPGGQFIFQIDTTDLFNSPLLTEHKTYAHSSLITWNPELNWIEAQVYYWRIAPIGIEVLKSNQWKGRSFIYMSDHAEGWNQSHYFQWLENTYFKLNIDTNRVFQFDTRIWDIRIKNKMKELQDFWVFVNNTPWSSLNPKDLAPAISIFIWHPESSIFTNSGTDYGSMRYSRDGFVYRMDKRADRANIKRLLEAAPEGSRIFFHTILDDENSNLYVNDWVRDRAVLGYTIFDVLESYGAQKFKLMQLRGAVPYTFVFDKGIGPVVEDIALNIYETIDISSVTTGKWEDGRVISPVISGLSYQRLNWAEQKVNDQASWLEIHGTLNNGKHELIRKIEKQYDVDLSFINPGQFKSIWLEYYTEDKTLKNASQLLWWRVFKKDLPDAAIQVYEGDDIVRDTLHEGESLLLNYTVKNLSSSSMDPILVRYTLTDTEGKSSSLLRRTKQLPGSGEIMVDHSIATSGLKGDYRLSIELNANMEQLEITDCNNRGSSSFHIIPDDRNPILNVTFDGKRIENGHVFYKAPIIRVDLRDPFSKSLLDNPQDFNIRIHMPGGLHIIIRDGLRIAQFEPATSLDDNTASFILTPNLHYPGEYVLEAQAKDKAGNLAGTHPFKLSFFIEEYYSEEIFSAYPNPTYDYVDFEYVLPDDRLPSVFILSVFSIDGKLVHEVSEEDFGELEKGVNRYRWNLQSQSLNKVPPGIYYYRLLTDRDSKDESLQGAILVYEP